MDRFCIGSMPKSGQSPSLVALPRTNKALKAPAYGCCNFQELDSTTFAYVAGRLVVLMNTLSPSRMRSLGELFYSVLPVPCLGL